MPISPKSTSRLSATVPPTPLHAADSIDARQFPRRRDTLTQSSFNQTWKRNQTELAWDISKKAGARIGYRYGDRVFDHFNDFLPGDEDHIVVHEHTALLGFWARPTHALRLNFDLEHINYDNVIVRMAPRKESRYRFQTSYTPAPVGGSGRVDQHSARCQRRLTDKLRRTQPELWIHRLARAARALRPRSGLQLQRRDPECPDLLQRHAANRGDASLRDQCWLPVR